MAEGVIDENSLKQFHPGLPSFKVSRDDEDYEEKETELEELFADAKRTTENIETPVTPDYTFPMLLMMLLNNTTYYLNNFLNLFSVNLAPCYFTFLPQIWKYSRFFPIYNQLEQAIL